MNILARLGVIMYHTNTVATIFLKISAGILLLVLAFGAMPLVLAFNGGIL